MVSEDRAEARLRGEIHLPPRRTHEYRDEVYYRMYLSVPRLSGVPDILPITLPGRLLPCAELSPGRWIAVSGRLHSYNRLREGKRHLMLSLLADALAPVDAWEAQNEVRLSGYLCREPQYRMTPLKRRIADLLVAVNRPFGPSDYLPVIAWGDMADLARNYRVGSAVSLEGRFQSREYTKRLPDGSLSPRVAYEVSAARLRMGEN